LLTFANGIAERVKELQAIAAEQAAETAEKCVAELNQLRKDAHVNKAYAAAVSAVMGKAKILNLITDRIEDVTNVDYNSAQSMTDIGRKLLQSIGFASPDDLSIKRAVEANDVFVDTLQAIYQEAQALTLEQVDD
jgi:HD-GYP domain-containing protein (c-di-GMP phosphodiesterase class II)